MPRECPGCGVKTTQEARFCRRCGAPLKPAIGHDTDPPASPVAQTVPLTDEGRATDGLAAEESQRLGEGTSRIRRTEMEEMLRRVAREHGADGLGAPSLTQPDGSSAQTITADAASASPVTSTLKTPGDGNNSAPPAQSPAQPRPPAGRRWRLMVFGLLCIALFGGVLIFIALRRSKASDASAPTAPPASEETQPVAAAAADAPQIGPLTVASTPPSNTPRPSPSERPRETGAATRPPVTTEAPALPGASPAPTVTAPDSTQATTTPAPLSAAAHYQRGVQLWATDRRSALEEFRAAVPAVPDAYYYLGSEYYPEGRDVKTLSDGELRAALNYFTRATSGPHSAQASSHAQALGKEYDRRKKKQSRP